MPVDNPLPGPPARRADPPLATSRWRRLPLPVLATLLLIGTAGCTADEEAGPPVVAPGAPGEPGRVLTEAPPEAPASSYSGVDVHFLHGMIAHHAQALRMTDLVDDRTDSEDIARFAERIEIAQRDEIALMEDWLETRGEPTDGNHQHGDGNLMPGMLTEAQFTELGAATGDEFDRRFLELMGYHHEGALIMVDELIAAGGGREAALQEIVTDIDSTQRIEIDRITRMLADD